MMKKERKFNLEAFLLEETGLWDLPVAQQKVFLKYAVNELELRIGERLIVGLSETQLMEFDSFISRDEEMIRGWLMKYDPNYKKSEIYQTLEIECPDTLTALIEYGSMQWFRRNIPEHSRVIIGEIKKLVNEIIENKEAIVESVIAKTESKRLC